MSAVIERPETSVTVFPGETTPMQLVERAMAAGNLDLVERFMALQERWEANRARKAFDAAIAAAKAEIKPIVKNREVDFTSQKGRTNYAYEDFAQIANEVDPILARYGLAYRHRPKQDAKALTITCVLSHRDGHFEETSLSALNDESGNKNSIQSIGSTATYLQRYTLKLALGLAVTKDDDGRASAGTEEVEYITAEQVKFLDKLLTDTGSNRANFLRMCKIDILEDMPARMYAEAARRLEEKKQGKAS